MGVGIACVQVSQNTFHQLFHVFYRDILLPEHNLCMFDITSTSAEQCKYNAVCKIIKNISPHSLFFNSLICLYQEFCLYQICFLTSALLVCVSDCGHVFHLLSIQKSESRAVLMRLLYAVKQKQSSISWTFHSADQNEHVYTSRLRLLQLAWFNNMCLPYISSTTELKWIFRSFFLIVLKYSRDFSIISTFGLYFIHETTNICRFHLCVLFYGDHSCYFKYLM